MRSAGSLALWLLLIADTGHAAEPSLDGALKTEPPLITALKTELARAQSKLRLRGYEAPYFLAYAVRELENFELVGRFGALQRQNRNRSRAAYVEVRVGDYLLDNSGEPSDSTMDPDDVDGYEPGTEVALDDSPEAIRGTLWLLTDMKYKRALSAFAKKRGKRATSLVEDEDLPSFSKEKPVNFVAAQSKLVYDDATLEDLVRAGSARFRNYAHVFDSNVRIDGERVRRTLVTSEGTLVATERLLYGLHIVAGARAKDGTLIEQQKDFYGHSTSDLPSKKQLISAIDRIADELSGLQRAPVIDPYNGPAILMEEAAGVFFHETLGHRLEGERQNDQRDGRTFRGQVGRRVLPEFLSIEDDPTQRAVGSQPLNGFYTHDDEGIAARAVKLIDRGVLRDFIKSRTPITGSAQSNGHGRSEGTADPMSRMGNLFIRSEKRVAIAELKRLLLEEVRRQGKPFGLVITDIAGGSTNTSNYGYQAFKGQPRLVYRVDAKTGEETLVRGVEMVGTPLTSVARIVATSDTVGVFNGYCGAESGYVPVATIAPAVLMSEIELQRAQRPKERSPILPPPWGPILGNKK